MTTAPAGERYGEVAGYYFERRQATFPGVIGSRAVQAGDVVNVIVKAGGLQSEFRYRVEATQQDASKKRVLVVAAEDYTGTSPNVSAGYDTAPRYLDQHVAALEAAGYEVDTFNIDAPPQNGGTPNPAPVAPIKHPTYLGVMSHFDAVNYYTGDDFAPQDPTNTDPRRPTSETAQTGNYEMAPWAHKVLLELREYANNGGKLVVDGRNVHQTFTSTSSSLSAVGPTPGPRTSCSASTTRRTTRATTTCPAPPGSARAPSPTTSGRTTWASSGVRAVPASRARSSTRLR